MSAHTPGPWEIGNEDNQCCDVSAGEVSFSLDRSDAVTGREFVISREEMLANAHLIAAAPDLLKLAREYARSLDADSDSSRSAHARLQQVEAIIAKAEGRS